VKERFRNSLGWKVALFIVAAGALTDVASSHAALGGWHSSGGAGRISVIFLVPFMLVIGVVCGIFFVKHSPRTFLDANELSDDPEERRKFSDLRVVDFVGYISYSFFAVIPIMLVAWGLSELGLAS
jgi:peptidoglycan/LPS O-acetylase OafA/YrhL